MSPVADQYVIRLAEQHGYLLPIDPEGRVEVARDALQGLGILTAETMDDERIVDVAMAGGVDLSGVADRWAWFDPDTEQGGEGFVSVADAARVAVMTLDLALQ